MKRQSGLDLLRAIAIVWVMLFHSWIVGGLGVSFQWLGNFGWMGVDLFFVLSGYLIGTQLLKPLSRGEPLGFAAFYLRRAFRVLPAFLFVLALYLFWPAWREAPSMQPSWQFLTFTLNFFIDYQHNQAFSHAWSLCVEEHFYLVAPWLAWWLARRPSMMRFIALTMVVMLGGMLIRAFIWMHALAPVQADSEAFGLRYLQDIYYPTYTRLDGLLAGILLATAQIYRPSYWMRIQRAADWLLLTGLFILGCAIWLCEDRGSFVATVFAYPIISLGMACLVASATTSHGGLGRLTLPGANGIALISYSMYLSHKGAMHLVSSWLSSFAWFHGLLAFAIYAAAILAIGSTLFFTIERPFLRWRDRLWTKAGAANKRITSAALRPNR